MANNIYVEGGTYRQKKYVLSLTNFCLQKLLPRHKTLTVEIQLKRLSDGSVGNCMVTDGFPKNPREFEIEIDSRMKQRDLLTTLAHEMVHVKQYIRGEIPYVFPEDGNYYEWSWEIEAFGREWSLFHQWTVQERLDQKRWARLV